MKLSKYCELFEFDDKKYLFNFNNGSLIELDNESILKIKKAINLNQYEFREEEINILASQNFLVEDNFDENQKNINKITYSISKYNNDKTFLKVDFALTNQCNFNCPYCFEKDNLCKIGINNENKLSETGELLLTYIEKKLIKGVTYVEIVFYGGEPTLEKNFIINFINKLDLLCNKYNAEYKYVFITNGFLFDENFILELDNSHCKFIQVTIDGEKERHNTRRTNVAKVNTFDTIVENINKLVKNGFHVVIRLNVDKESFSSIKRFLINIENLIPKEYFGKYLSVDIARVFGCCGAYDLYEYENYRKELVDISIDKNLIKPRLNCKDLTTFCIAESLSNDLVIDFKGNLYRCWNNVFDESFKIGTLDNLLQRDCNVFETSERTLEFVSNLSLDKVNSGKCFECKYCKYCQGLCPAIRKNIIHSIDRNIYNNEECKQIVRKRVEQLIKYIGGGSYGKS